MPSVGLRPGRSTSTEILPALHSDMPATRSLSPVSSLGPKSRPPSSDGPADSVGANSAPASPRSVPSCGAVDGCSPSMSENIMGSLEQRNADISTPDALQDCVLPVTWQPDDVHLQGVQVTQVIDDAVFVSSSETAVFQFCVRHNLGVKACNELLAILRHASFDPTTIRYANLETDGHSEQAWYSIRQHARRYYRRRAGCALLLQTCVGHSGGHFGKHSIHTISETWIPSRIQC
mmetsp:Transcript_79452/g.128692  ORF Transcript_79452/g.128692 Transcript_79452/m.128692 type:complete len:234 (-) Transcript_79452:468-1169(-)